MPSGFIQVVKVAGLAASIALVSAHWLSPLDATTLGIVLGYLLLVRIT